MRSDQIRSDQIGSDHTCNRLFLLDFLAPACVLFPWSCDVTLLVVGLCSAASCSSGPFCCSSCTLSSLSSELSASFCVSLDCSASIDLLAAMVSSSVSQFSRCYEFETNRPVSNITSSPASACRVARCSIDGRVQGLLSGPSTGIATPAARSHEPGTTQVAPLSHATT